MRTFYLLILLLVGPYCLAQDYDFTHLNGLRGSDGTVFFNTCGYDIAILSQAGDIDNAKAVKQLKKKLKIKEAIRYSSDESLGVKNLVIEVEREELVETPRIYTENVVYLLQKEAGEMVAIYFTTVAPRDILFEQVFISEWLVDGLDLFISDSWTATQIYLAGEWIKLGTACQWRGPNNVYFGGGQISWSEFPSMERAIQDRDTRIIANRKEGIKEVLDEEIEVLFEGVPTLARRIVYIPVNHAKSYVGMPLVVYYIAEEIRGHYMSCVLSNYGYNRNDYELALLLKEFMIIPQLPTTAYNPFDVPEYDTYVYDELETLPEPIDLLEFGVSMWSPMGKLRNPFGLGMGVNMLVGFPVKRTMTIDLNVQLQIPFEKNEFTYYYKGGGEDLTDSDLIAVVGLRLRNQHNLKKNLNLNTYAGVGLGIISTDLVKEVNDDGTKEYYAAYTPDFLAGASLRYKWIGLFAEFHYTPFGLSKRLDKDFGGPSFNLGAFICY